MSYFAGFLSGLIGSMGFGGGGILIIYLVMLTDMPQLKAQGINLIFFIPCAALSVLIYSIKKEINFREIYPVIIGGILGALPAALILRQLETAYLGKIFAVFLLFNGIKSIIDLKKAK